MGFVVDKVVLGQEFFFSSIAFSFCRSISAPYCFITVTDVTIILAAESAVK